MSLEERSSGDSRPRIAGVGDGKILRLLLDANKTVLVCLALLPVNMFWEIKIIAEIKPFFIF